MKNLLVALFAISFTVAAQADDLRDMVEITCAHYDTADLNDLVIINRDASRHSGWATASATIKGETVLLRSASETSDMLVYDVSPSNDQYAQLRVFVDHSGIHGHPGVVRLTADPREGELLHYLGECGE